jgi:hypothetical protein
MAPKIDRTNLVQVRIKAGQNFNFDVGVTGEPPPTKKWTHSGKELKNGGRMKLVVEDYRIKLVVRDATRADTGTYTLTAENVNGKDEAKVEVIVIGEQKMWAR